MKKITVFILLLSLSVASFSQVTTHTDPELKASLLKKSKRQGTAATITLLGGITCVVVVPLAWGLTTKNGGGLEAVAWLWAAGLVAIPASIPLYIASGRNKKKAMRLSLNNETVPQPQNNGFVTRAVPSLTLKISL